MQNSAVKLKVASTKQPALYYFDTFSFCALAFLGINLLSALPVLMIYPANDSNLW